MSETYLITGATGHVASLVVPQLRAKDAKVRVLVRDAKKGEPFKSQGVEVAIGDFERPETLPRALEGVTSVFLVTPPGPHSADFATRFLEVARATPTKPRIVRLSALKGSPNGPTDNTRQHGRTDRELQDSGLSYTILRPHFFMQNMMSAAQSIAKDGTMYFGMGDARLGLIDVRDIADVAAAVLLDHAWDRGIYELTGPESITFHDAARHLSEALGRPVKYVPVPPEAVEQSMKQMGAGDWFAGVMRDYSRAYASGWGDYTNGLVQKIAGHPARSFGQFAREVFAPAMQRKG